MWSDAWVGLPYRALGRGPEAYDCLGLFVTLQRMRHGREVFDPMCTAAQALRRGFAAQEKPNWRAVDRAQEGDALLFKVRGMELHVGYALDARLMLHTDQDVGESMMEDYRSPRWGDRLEGIYTYVG